MVVIIYWVKANNTRSEKMRNHLLHESSRDTQTRRYLFHERYRDTGPRFMVGFGGWGRTITSNMIILNTQNNPMVVIDSWILSHRFWQKKKPLWYEREQMRASVGKISQLRLTISEWAQITNWTTAIYKWMEETWIFFFFLYKQRYWPIPLFALLSITSNEIFIIFL